MITLLLCIIIYLGIAILSAFYSLQRGPYKEWEGSLLVPVAIVMLWPIGMPWYIKQEPLDE